MEFYGDLPEFYQEQSNSHLTFEAGLSLDTKNHIGFLASLQLIFLVQGGHTPLLVPTCCEFIGDTQLRYHRS